MATVASLTPGLEPIRQVAITLGIVAGVILGIAYLWSQVRSGGAKASGEAIDALKARNQVLVDERDECTTALHAARREVSHLEGVVAANAREIEQLRGLIMGERLPKAMQDGFSEVIERLMAEIGAASQRNIEAFAGVVRTMEIEYLKPIMGVIDRRESSEPVRKPGEERRT